MSLSIITGRNPQGRNFHDAYPEVRVYPRERFKTKLMCLSIVLLLALTGLALLSHGSHAKLGPQRYVLVVDCGSSGTRIYAYLWHPPKGTELPNLEEISPMVAGDKVPRKLGKGMYNRVETQPGLDRYASQLRDIGPKGLGPLLDWARAVIPHEQQRHVPVFLFGTAGLRRLPVKDREAVMGEIDQVLGTSGFRYQKGWARILDGMDEGMYGWVALNYLQGLLDNPDTAPTSGVGATLGALDLGGSSLQVSMLLSEKGASSADLDMRNISLGKLSHQPLLTHSFQNFGMNDAFDRSIALLLNDMAGSRSQPASDLGLTQPSLSNSSTAQSQSKRGSHPDTGNSSVTSVETATGELSTYVHRDRAGDGALLNITPLSPPAFPNSPDTSEETVVPKANRAVPAPIPPPGNQTLSERHEDVKHKRWLHETHQQSHHSFPERDNRMERGDAASLLDNPLNPTVQGALGVGPKAINSGRPVLLHQQPSSQHQRSGGPGWSSLNFLSIARVSFRSLSQQLKAQDLVDSHKLEIKHPCLHLGYSRERPWASASHPSPGTNTTVRLVGAPDWMQCRALMRRVLLSHAPCSKTPCTLGYPLPPLRGKYMALTGFYVVWRFLKIPSGGTLDHLLAHTEQHCDLRWEEVESSLGEHINVEKYCAWGTYVVDLLREGLKLDDQQVLIGGGDMGWPLGAALVEGSKLPELMAPLKPDHQHALAQLESSSRAQTWVMVLLGVCLAMMIYYWRSASPRMPRSFSHGKLPIPSLHDIHIVVPKVQ